MCYETGLKTSSVSMEIKKPDSVTYVSDQSLMLEVLTNHIRINGIFKIIIIIVVVVVVVVVVITVFSTNITTLNTGTSQWACVYLRLWPVLST